MSKHTPGPWLPFVDEDDFDSSRTIMRVNPGHRVELIERFSLRA